MEKIYFSHTYLNPVPLVLFILLVSLTSTSAKTISVGKEGDFGTIGAAIEQATAHDTIFISSGNYHENSLEIKKPLYIYGEGYPRVIGNYKEEIFIVNADSVTIRGLQVEQVNTSYIKDLAGISVVNCEGCQILDNRLIDTFFGIYLKKAKSSVVSGNFVRGQATEEAKAGNAIHIWQGEQVLVAKNEVSGHRDGIYFEFVDDSRIMDNISKGNLRYGLHFMFSNDDHYEGNTFKNNGSGVAVMFSRNIIMRNNNFLQNQGSASYGILLKEISDGEMSGNRFYKNSIGIYAEGTNRLQIQHNNFVNNGWALNIKGNCLDNVITLNNFVANSLDLITNSSSNANEYKQNYWSQYKGYDLDRNGIGDVPYRPVKLFAYVINRVPASIIMLRSLLVDLLNFAESVSPSLTPSNLMDEEPLMKPVS